ncbi:virulence factor [Streptomyces sp. ISL-66]|uniref:polymorphic toxin-type HINT domain-containing protein n=1 Tax=Streptomyces sp. ISL-66 TaxID=2819186 RepID=UPI001BEB22AD|nr:polymorphic toxin-type HINT domain-containing protein [Streptomyces sp. ISL-66]MBT2466504.1 virulence factor [Streptomyces sp. ISL-66]
MRKNATAPRRRRFGNWTSFLTTTAVATAAAVTFTGSGVQPLDGLRSAAAAEPAPYDLEAAQKVREAQCLLGNVLRKGGAEMKAVARTGMKGTEAELLATGARNYWDGTPLSAAYAKDHAAANAKFAEMDDRKKAWQANLNMYDIPPGYTPTGFQWPPDDPTIFTATGYAGWIADRFWTGESDFYTDTHPLAGKESVDAATKIAKARYYPEAPATYEDRKEWEWHMAGSTPMYADDARIFLQNGGFPTSAPAVDSMEFRIDVEQLKARFASCATRNPLDPHKVLTAEAAIASQEWQAEIAGQNTQRDIILGAEQAASKDLQIAAQAMAEALGQSMIASRLTDWEAHFLKVPAGSGRPSASEFTKARTGIEQAQARATGRLYVASRAAQDAQAQAAKVTTAQNAAYAVADQAGLPRGRGLLYGQQAAQITKASAAAAQAAAKATETALNATRASAADSKTLNSLAMTQAHASKAEFRRKAAEEAAAQAKSAAEGAAAQAVKAAENATKAKAAQVKAENAEKEAKTAAADAKAKRKQAEDERDYAKSQKELAESERAKAQAAEARAQTQRTEAGNQLSAAQTAGTTAESKMKDALDAEKKAVTARNNASDAEQQRDALEAKAYAKESKAVADEGTEAAGASRTAATAARTAANNADTAAKAARAEADTATEAATNARAAATRAQGAAKRAQAAADAAKKDVAITEAAVTKAHSAAADAIDASDAAKWNAITAKSLAETAHQKAEKAKTDATVARSEAVAAGAESIRTAGFAFATAQAAVAASESAMQVVKPANDAIELGSPYKETDSSAGLAVLTGQAAKTAAEQQAALAQAKADQAAKAAAEAKKLAEQADADAKAAAEAALQAADWAAKAAKSAQAAQNSANEAAAAAKAAKAAETRTVEYNRQATADAAAAQTAATTAGTYASDADAAATDAERDAASARTAASAAEADASTANTVATKAETDAKTAEDAAARAQEAAKEAQDAATRAENQKSRDTIASGGATGQKGAFARHTIEPVGEPVDQNKCVLEIGFDGCTVTFKLTYNLTLDFYLCTDPAAPENVTEANCPAEYVTWISAEPMGLQAYYKDVYFSRLELALIFDKVFLKTLWHMITDDFVNCAKGDTKACIALNIDAMMALKNKRLELLMDSMLAYRAVMRTGVGLEDARALANKAEMDPSTIAALEREADLSQRLFGSCKRNSFPASVPVLMADGSHKPIGSVRVGDVVMAGDTAAGTVRTQQVTAAFGHDTSRLIDITLADGSRLSTTAGHRLFVVDRGWIFASDLAVNDRLRDPQGRDQAIAALGDRGNIAPVEVFDLTVDGLHTFFVQAQGAAAVDVLVHNCLDIVGDEGISGAHTLSDHVALDRVKILEKLEKDSRATEWTDRATAASSVRQAFDEWSAVPGNKDKLLAWLKKQQGKPNFDPRDDLFPITWKLRDQGSLGKSWKKGPPDADGNPTLVSTPVGNGVFIQIKQVKKKVDGKHQDGYVVYTSYPTD